MSRIRAMSALGAVVLVLAACGSDGGDAETASAEDGMSLSITAPEDGAAVTVPFTVEFDSSEELGPTESGAHHVHIFWDGDDSLYTVVEADSFEITEAPEGEHTLNASLRNADHSPAGVETEIAVTVGADAGTGTETETETETETDSDAGDTGGTGGMDY